MMVVASSGGRNGELLGTASVRARRMLGIWGIHEPDGLGLWLQLWRCAAVIEKLDVRVCAQSACAFLGLRIFPVSGAGLDAASIARDARLLDEEEIARRQPRMIPGMQGTHVASGGCCSDHDSAPRAVSELCWVHVNVHGVKDCCTSKQI